MKVKPKKTAERIRALIQSARIVQGLSFEQVCAGCGISEHTMLGYIRGNIQPGAEHLCFLADYFGVSADYILGREGYLT